MDKKTPRRPEAPKPNDPRGPDRGQKTIKPGTAAPGEQQHRPRMTGRTIYDTIVDDILPLLKKPRTGIPLIIAVLGIVALFLWFRTEGLSYETSLVGLRLGGSPAELQSSSLRKCLAEARRLDKPYAIEAVTFLIQFEKDKLNDQDVIRDSRRIFYTLRALKPINSSQKLFSERIDTHVKNPSFEHWYGNEKEEFHSPNDRKNFNVFFDMEKDDVRTVVTGANFLLPLPFEARPELEGHLNVLANQDFYAYPNEMDVICELNMIVESRTLQIQPVGSAAKRFFEGTLQSENATYSYDQSSPTGVRTISARWRNVLIGETVGIHFGWPQ